jgi:hypothetical protein
LRHWLDALQEYPVGSPERDAIHGVDRRGLTIGHLAVVSRSVRCLKAWFDAGGDPTAKDTLSTSIGTWCIQERWAPGFGIWATAMGSHAVSRAAWPIYAERIRDTLAKTPSCMDLAMFVHRRGCSMHDGRHLSNHVMTAIHRGNIDLLRAWKRTGGDIGAVDASSNAHTIGSYADAVSQEQVLRWYLHHGGAAYTSRTWVIENSRYKPIWIMGGMNLLTKDDHSDDRLLLMILANAPEKDHPRIQITRQALRCRMGDAWDPTVVSSIARHPRWRRMALSMIGCFQDPVAMASWIQAMAP